MKEGRNWTRWGPSGDITFGDQPYITKSFVDGRPVPQHRARKINQQWFSIKQWGTKGYK